MKQNKTNVDSQVHNADALIRNKAMLKVIREMAIKKKTHDVKVYQDFHVKNI